MNVQANNLMKLADEIKVLAYDIDNISSKNDLKFSYHELINLRRVVNDSINMRGWEYTDRLIKIMSRIRDKLDSYLDKNKL